MPRPFSPHTRGCSRQLGEHGDQRSVFPAYAGMFLTDFRVLRGDFSFPRIRGDVPGPGQNAPGHGQFSPHTRGCSLLCVKGGFQLVVFPAYAGMFLLEQVGTVLPPRFPRIRGDVPLPLGPSTLTWTFSPHTRGCSGVRPLYTRHLSVFPAYAGMFRGSLKFSPAQSGFPRIRGDVPVTNTKT